MKKILTIVMLITATTCVAQLNIVPMPAEVKMVNGNFILSPSTKIILQGNNLEKTADFLNHYLKTNYGFALKIQKATIEENAIVFSDAGTGKTPANYHLNINKKAINVDGGDEAGVFYGMQTLLQLFPLKTKTVAVKNNLVPIPQLSITDYPRFGYRGMHLDVCRHFFSIDYIKRYLDFLAAYKFNKFHWHLTDDQGWRIEIKKYPLLTEVGGYRNGTIIGRFPGKGNDSIHYGGYYTQDQVREIVKYATDRYIDVIPEIEMPGHASAAIAAYPQLSCFPDEPTKISPTTFWAGSRSGKQVQQTWGVFEDVFAPTEYTFKFLDDVIDEVVQLFPSKYIHIGGDECPKENWKRSAFCQQLIKDKSLKDEHGLQSYFIQRMENYINGKGKKIIGWNEILEGGLAPNATVMSWQGEQGGITAAKQNHDVIMTPDAYCYFDHSQSKNEDSVTIGSYLPLDKVYRYEPIPAALNAGEATHVLGAQANVWTEYIGNTKKLEYILFPRMAALAEVLWSPKEKRSWPDFESRLPGIFERYDASGINYSHAYLDLQAYVVPVGNSIKWKIESKNKKGKIIYTTPGKPHTTAVYSEPILINQSGEYSAALTDGKNRPVSRWVKQQFYLNKASGRKVTLTYPPSDNYPGSGGFTLVDGVLNSMRMSKSSEFLGFLGKDAEATIDLETIQPINQIIFHAFEQTDSWIYRPAVVFFYTSTDGLNYTLVDTISEPQGAANLLYTVNKNISARFIKVTAKNYGIIPSGRPGAGTAAWLFTDEIEVK